MLRRIHLLTSALMLIFFMPFTACAHGDRDDQRYKDDDNNASIQLGPRPFFLVNDMDESPLKKKLQSCHNCMPN